MFKKLDSNKLPSSIPRFLSREQTMAILGVSSGRLWAITNNPDPAHRLESKKCGRNRVYREDKILQYMENLPS